MNSKTQFKVESRAFIGQYSTRKGLDIDVTALEGQLIQFGCSFFYAHKKSIQSSGGKTRPEHFSEQRNNTILSSIPILIEPQDDLLSDSTVDAPFGVRSPVLVLKS